MIIHNPILTGSFTVNGTDVASITSSAASIASLNSYTASLNAKSSSFATTGSNTFVGNQVVSGSLTVTGSITTPGTLTAQTLVVQTITSSVSVITGSTNFGSSVTLNNHLFTGSVNITGSLSVATTGTELQVNANGVNIGNALTDIHIVSGSLRIAGPVTSSGALLNGALSGTSATFSGNVRKSGAVGVYTELQSDGIYATGTDLYLLAPSTKGVYIYTNNTQALAIASTGAATFSGQVDAASFYTSDTRYVSNQIQAGYNTNAEDVDLWINYSGYQGGTTRFRDFRIGNGKNGQIAFFDGSTGAATFSSSVTATGTLKGGGTNYLINTSTGTDPVYQRILTTGGDVIFGIASSTGTSLLPGVGNYATVLYNNTNTDISFGTNQLLRMTITSGGNVGIGSTTINDKLDVYGNIRTSINTSYYAVSNYLGTNYYLGSSETTDNIDFKINGGGTFTSGGNFRWFTQTGGATPTERMRITSGGVVQITNPSDAQLSLAASGTSAYVRFSNSAGDVWGIGNSFSAANTDFQLYNFTTAAYGFRVSRGGIYANTTAAAANVQIDSNGYFARSTSSSKYKNSITNYDKGLDIVNQLRPVYYKGNNDGDKQFAGLIAEEVHNLGLTEFVQYAEDGSPDALAYQNMVALLTKAIQELTARVQQLENK